MNFQETTVATIAPLILVHTIQAQLFIEDFDTFSGWSEGPGTSMHSKNGQATNGWQKGIYKNGRRPYATIGPNLGIGGSQGGDSNPVESPPQGWIFRDITGEVNTNGNYMMRAMIRSEQDVPNTPNQVAFKIGDAATTFATFANSNELDVEFVMQGVSGLGGLHIDQASFKDGFMEFGTWTTFSKYEDYGLWFKMLMNINTNNAIPTLWMRDVDDTTGTPLEDWERFPTLWPQNDGSTGFVGLPFSAPEAAGFRIARIHTAFPTATEQGAQIDNFISGHPLLANQGDFDGDGDIDGNDFLIWQNNFPSTDGAAISFTGDATGDGNVDGDDFLVWQNSFPFPAALTKTPEPASLGVVALGGLLMLRYRRE